TYFVQMLTLLEARGYPVELTVDAAGAWTSFNETAAYRLDVAPLHPDVVVFLNGLNDLTQNKPEITRNPVKSYIQNMSEALELSHRNGVRMVVVLQPLLADKRFTTPLERRILQFPVNAVDRLPAKGAAWPQRYVEAFQIYRQHLERMAARRGMSFVDCPDALSDERATPFADFWHFADPGHRLLARCIAEGLIPVLDSLPRTSLDR